MDVSSTSTTGAAATLTVGGESSIEPDPKGMEVRVIWRVITVMVITGNYW